VAARDAAEAAMDAAAVTASYAVLTAPFDGVVTERTADPGSMAGPGATLLTLDDSSAFHLEVALDEARASQAVVGETAEVLVNEAGNSASAWVSSRIAEVARMDPTAHSFIVKIELPGSPDLRSGLFRRARFSGPSRRVLTVPASAVVRRGQLTFVYAVDADGRVRLEPVSAGASSGDRIEVLAGLADGRQVVTSPPASLSDGARVTGARR
jgi:RND family efflux transporter MFP subunit